MCLRIAKGSVRVPSYFWNTEAQLSPNLTEAESPGYEAHVDVLPFVFIPFCF